MANRIYLIETESFRKLDAAPQAHLEACSKLVPGVKLRRVSSFGLLASNEDFKDGVVLVPLLASSAREGVASLLNEIEDLQPFSTYFAIQFVIIGTEKAFKPEHLLELDWVEELDKFYDIAIPTSFVVFYRDDANVQSFQLAASMSSLLRQIDSLEELRRLGREVAKLESLVDSIAKNK